MSVRQDTCECHNLLSLLCREDEAVSSLEQHEASVDQPPPPGPLCLPDPLGTSSGQEEEEDQDHPRASPHTDRAARAGDNGGIIVVVA